jgi:RecB family exonuclease
MVAAAGVAEWLGHDAREATALARLADGLRLLAGEGEAAVALDLAAFAEELLALLATASVPVSPHKGGLALHTPLALYGGRYDHVFVLGACEGLLPEPVADDPYLDFREREGLRGHGLVLESAAEAAARERLTFWMMLQAVQQRLVLSWPRTRGNRPALPSPLIAALGAEPSPSPAIIGCVEEHRQVALPLPDALPGDAVADAARAALAVERRRESSAPPDAHDGRLGYAVPLPEAFSVTALTVLGQCPFRWFGEQLLGLGAPDETAAEPGADRRGSLSHRVLELALRAAVMLDCLDDADALDLLLSAALDAALGLPVTGEPWAGAIARAVAASTQTAREEDLARGRELAQVDHWPMLRAEWLAELTQAVRSPGFRQPGARPERFEVRFRQAWHEGLTVAGRIDRVDRLAANGGHELALVDYKSGSGERPPGIKSPSGSLTVDLQLTLYGDLCPVGPDDQVAQTAYFRLGSGKNHSLPRNHDPALLEAFATEVRERFERGDFAVQPDPGLAACRLCDLGLACRVGLRCARKEG